MGHTVLLDTNLHSLALEGEAVFVKKIVQWGHKTLENDVIQMNPVPPLNSSRKKQQSHRDAIWTIRQMAKSEIILPCTYWGLEWEIGRRKPIGRMKINLLESLKTKELDCLPSEIWGFWSFVRDVELNSVSMLIATTDETALLKLWQSAGNKQPSHWNNHAKAIPRLNEIIGNSKHYADALHLWICELNEVEYLVTDELRFRDYIEKTQQLVTKTKIINPDELLEVCGVKKILFPKERLKTHYLCSTLMSSWMDITPTQSSLAACS